MIGTRPTLLASLSEEYYSGFLRDGGSSFRVFVGSDIDLDRLKTSLQTEPFGPIFAIDGFEARLHTLAGFYNMYARSIDWSAAASAFITNVFDCRGWVVPDRSRPTLASISKANGVDPRLVRTDVQRELTSRILLNSEYCSEFARAIIWLIKATFDPDDRDAEAVGRAVWDWLSGTIAFMRLVRPAGLYRKVGRKNARALFISTCRFLRSIGHLQLTVIVDATAYASGPKGKYSMTACTDLYEVMRQFIDGLEDLAGVALIFLMNRSFLENEKRGIDSYQALKMRLAIEAFDPARPNLSAPMVVLS